MAYFLQLGGYDQFFDKIYGSSTHKSKIVRFNMLLQEYSLKPEECLFITDTIGDIKEARQVGVVSIAVTWGFHDEKLLASQNPLAIVQKPDDLAQVIEKLF